MMEGEVPEVAEACLKHLAEGETAQMDRHIAGEPQYWANPDARVKHPMGHGSSEQPLIWIPREHFKALRSRFQGFTTGQLEELTRSLIVFNTDIGQLHKDGVGKGSSRVSEDRERMFFDIFSRIGGRHIMRQEVTTGGTRLFLESTDAFITSLSPTSSPAQGSRNCSRTSGSSSTPRSLRRNHAHAVSAPKKVLSLDLGRLGNRLSRAQPCRQFSGDPRCGFAR